MGEYSFHFNSVKATKEINHAENKAETMHNWLKESKFVKTLMVVRGDSQKMNTGDKTEARSKFKAYLSKTPV